MIRRLSLCSGQKGSGVSESVQCESPGSWASSRKKCLRNSYPSGMCCMPVSLGWDHWQTAGWHHPRPKINRYSSNGIPWLLTIQLGGIRMKFSHRPQAGKETHDVGVSLVATCGDKVCVTSGGSLLLLCLMYLCLSQALPHCNDATFPKKSQRDLQKMSDVD